MIVITGGSGFIGSCVVSYLNSKNINDILIVDNIGKTDKWKTIAQEGYLDYIHKDKFINWLYTSEDSKNIEIIIHMGACCSTTEKDFDYLIENNYDYTKKYGIGVLKTIRECYMQVPLLLMEMEKKDLMII